MTKIIYRKFRKPVICASCQQLSIVKIAETDQVRTYQCVTCGSVTFQALKDIEFGFRKFKGYRRGRNT